jgi:GTP-binding protein EngB required for normal cell division
MGSVELQSKDHRALLDIIDTLRSKGISKYVDLPEIIVCGDQSAGKSSVLEAISGMSFPTKDNLCTRFPTEVVLRRDPTTGVKVSINPGPKRSASERDRLFRFGLEFDVAKPDLGSVVEKAKEAMGLSAAEDSKRFSTDTLRVELRGPKQPHLTMVDLPGLFRAGSKDQTKAEPATVHEMVRDYMKRPRSIILAVVSAKADFALQEITELARELDRKGARTLGLITKPDYLHPGSDSEASYLKLAQNKDVEFRLGWHVLKNRDYDARDATSAERDEAEERFFSEGAWSTLDPTLLGVKCLRPRLSNVLKDQILHQLPSLVQDVELGISDCRRRLERLGVPRCTIKQQRRYLLGVSQTFSALMKAAIDGVYNDSFFGSAKAKVGYQKRLRAVVQNNLTNFKDTIRLQGQARIIVDAESDSDDGISGTISRSEYINEVKELMRRSRGCELPGTFNPLIIGELFTEQCQPWRSLAMNAKDTILLAVYQVIQAILDRIAAEETLDGIFRIVSKGMDTLKKDLDQKVVELLDPHYHSHPITYNHYLTDTVQKAQSERRRCDLKKSLEQFFGAESFNNKQEKVEMVPQQIFSLFEERIEIEMERYASELMVDYMQAYYKVSMRQTVHSLKC